MSVRMLSDPLDFTFHLIDVTSSHVMSDEIRRDHERFEGNPARSIRILVEDKKRMKYLLD